MQADQARTAIRKKGTGNSGRNPQQPHNKKSKKRTALAKSIHKKRSQQVHSHYAHSMQINIQLLSLRKAQPQSRIHIRLCKWKSGPSPLSRREANTQLGGLEQTKASVAPKYNHHGYLSRIRQPDTERKLKGKVGGYSSPNQKGTIGSRLASRQCES